MILEILTAVATVVATVLPARGVIRKNAFIGIRTRAIMRNDDSWRRGHHAAVVPTCVAAAITIVVGVGFIAIGRANDATAILICSIPVVVGAFLSAAIAGRAVR